MNITICIKILNHNLNMKALVESRGFELISVGRDDTTLTKDYHMVKKIR